MRGQIDVSARLLTQILHVWDGIVNDRQIRADIIAKLHQANAKLIVLTGRCAAQVSFGFQRPKKIGAVC